jgi:energy-coupling factor transporter ATP-binding protein EcfA2
MKLRRLNIENFRAIKTKEIRFDDAVGRIRPVTVLAGPNGCGKTSVIFAIVQALRGVMGYRTIDVPDPDDLDIFREATVGGLVSRRLSAVVDLDLEFDAIELESIPQVFKETRDLRSRRESEPGQIAADSDTGGQAGDSLVQEAETLPELPGGRLFITWKFPPERNPDGSFKPPWFLSNSDPWGAVPWLYGRKYAVRGWLNRRLTNRSILDNVGGLFLFPQDRNLQSRVVGTTTRFPGFREGFGHDQGQRSSREVISVWGILEYLSSYSQAQRQAKEDIWEDRIRDGFKRICAPKEYLGFMYQQGDPNGAPYFRDGDSTYPLHMAASGEQVIIEYLTRLTHPSPMNHSLILIDEPEVHLHPGWIRQLYRALPQIGVDNQYILTTHSTELRALAAEDGSLVSMGEMGARH